MKRNATQVHRAVERDAIRELCDEIQRNAFYVGMTVLFLYGFGKFIWHELGL